MSTSIPSSVGARFIAPYRVAAIQYEPTLGEKEKNVNDLHRLVEEAARQEARLIVLTEMATTGYCWESRAEIAPFVEPIPGPTTDRFQQLASRYNCYIAVSLPEVDPSTEVYYNSMALIGPEGVIGTYRKIHSYIAEPRWARDGDLGMPVWETPLGRLSGLICMDAEYFEAGRIPALHGADVLLFPTNWLDEKSPSFYWMARAFENGVYVIAANRYGSERGVQFSGGSCVLNPDGSIQAYIDNGEGIVYGEVDLNLCRNKNWGHPGEEPTGNRLADRRPAEYITLTNNTYLWEPLRYHSLYELGELPPGQLSCVAIIQTNLQEWGSVGTSPAVAVTQLNASPIDRAPDTVMLSAAKHLPSISDTTQTVRSMVETLLNDHDPARPDVLVLPELMLPGPAPEQTTPGELLAHFQTGAIEVPGPETAALVKLANQFQISLVLGVAEREKGPVPTYYNTVLLIDPEGVYGSYRKLHLTTSDRLWASPGNKGLPTFDTPVGRIGLATGYDVLFPETVRVLAGKGADLVCAPALLNFPDPIGLEPTSITYRRPVAPEEYDPVHYLIWRLRAAEHNVYLAVANWSGAASSGVGTSPAVAVTRLIASPIRANGNSGIFSPSCSSYPWAEVIADEGEPTLTMMTIDTREQRTGRRSSTHPLSYAPGDVAGSLTGELAYDIRDSIPGNVVRSKPYLRKRMPFWYLDLVKKHL